MKGWENNFGGNTQNAYDWIRKLRINTKLIAKESILKGNT